MENEQRFLKRFNENRYHTGRECFHKPFFRDGYVYSTDSYIIARVKADLCENQYPTLDEPKRLPPFPDKTCGLKIYLDELVKVINSIPESEEIDVSGRKAECDECDGDGRVEWKYEDTDGEEHIKVDDCPICNGRGKVNKKTYEREERYIAINGMPLCVRLLMKVAEGMNDLGKKEAIITNLSDGRVPMGICFQDGIEVYVMPAPTEETIREIELK